ncbi:MAG: GIY-YIG nuclease family protein [Patescibacteria group bacterium]|jgi:putative endonuclease
MYYVYLLQSLKDSKLYIGRTDNLINRLEEHNRGNVQSTKYRRQLELIYYEAYRNREDSKGRERGLKKSGSVYMALIKRIGLSREQRNGLHPASRD